MIDRCRRSFTNFGNYFTYVQARTLTKFGNYFTYVRVAVLP